jgi:hypothetical protein
MPTVPRTIQIATVSQYLASHDVRVQQITRIGAIDPNLPISLYVERKCIQWIYDEDNDYDGLQAAADYLYALCGKYIWKAIQILDGGSGGQIAPATGGSDFTFRYLIPITAADFADATNYNNTLIAGRQLEVFWKNVPNFQTTTGFQILYTPTGFQVFVDDGSGGNAFNATTTNSDAEFDVFIVNPVTTAVTQNSRTDVLTADDSVIANVAAGASNTDLYTISIIPGGYTYTFGSIFAFGDTPPLNTPNGDDTLQIFTFQWNSNISKWVNITQSLNLPYTA